mmetsp:Transcript_26584/g.75078  ORF Transcript_26584/g.75078 Transcript_26584/m.75078 type:complete len:211 (+) Transcript_26584:126-758(+)
MSCCACTLQSYYSYVGVLTFFLSFYACSIAAQCPYNAHCKTAWNMLVATGVFGFLMTIITLNVMWSLDHVQKLKLESLSESQITTNTRRWGCYARNCPLMSRWVFTFIGVFIISGFLVANSACPKKGSDGWKNENGGQSLCNAPFNREPDPQQDFGIPIAFWFVIAMLGCRTRMTTKPLPFLYDPVPEMEKIDSSSVCTHAMRLPALCHP